METNMEMLQQLIDDLNHSNFPYCILHSYNTLYDIKDSDIDICVDECSEKMLDSFIWNLSYRSNTHIIQKIHYDIPMNFYYVLVNSDSQFFRFDFVNDNLGIHRYIFRARDFLDGDKVFRGFYVPPPEKEALYLLIKRVVKGRLLVSDRNRLRELYSKQEYRLEHLIKKYFGSKNIQTVRALLAKRDCDRVVITEELRKALYYKSIVLKPWKWPLIGYYQAVRILKRVVRPTGLFACILSPDGGGKSSVCNALLERLLGGFRRTRCLHWRPGLLPQMSTLFRPSNLNNQNPITYPCGPKKQSKILSLFRWMYYTLDFILGYYLRLLPMKIRTTAIIMDRYYYDIIVDPIRYGFNLPRWLVESVMPIIPKPDLCVYLDNSPQVLHTRKQELPLEELKKQVEHWHDFIHELPNSKIVTTDKPIDRVVNEVTQLIIDRRADMTEKMLKIEPKESMYIWESQLCKSYVALPSKKNCRWLIPTNPVIAEKAWNMYLPYSFWGKLYKGAFKSFAARGSMGMKKVIPQNTEVSGKLRNLLERALRRNDFALAISTGTPGPFRKTTAMIISADGTILGCVKIGNALQAIERVKHEASVLKRIKLNEHKSNIKLTIPLCIYEGALGNEYFLIQSSPSFLGKSRGYEFNNDYANILCTLIKSGMNKKKFIESRFYRQLKYGVQNFSLSFRTLLSDSLKYLEKQIGDEEIEFSLSHGDFVPWNILWNREEAFMFDWESAHFEAPVGIDLVHFLFQIAFLLKKCKGKSLLRYVAAEEAYEVLADRLGLKMTNSHALLLCYLLKMAIDEDREQPLSQSAVERRSLIKVLIKE